MNPRSNIARLTPREGEPRIYSVSELAQEIRLTIEDSFPPVIVQGEISNLKPHHPSGHIYFVLKDAGAQLRVALFKNRVRSGHESLENGVAVQIEGQIEFYPLRGEVTLIADRVAPIGYGALQARFDALKRKLEAEGLFREERKRPLPTYPTRVGIVTAPGAAALQDMLRILRQRAPYVRIALAPSAVQGEGAARAIAAAIGLLNDWGQVDVIIAGRGGGSLEDLWAFNEEAVVRAIAGSRIPTISAVGHEVDVTLADLAADFRAATPTHAAQHVAPAREEVQAALQSLSIHARERLRRELREATAQLTGMKNHHALRDPTRRVQDGRRALDDIADGLARGLSDWVLVRRRLLESHGASLQAYSPGRVLERSRDRVSTLGHRLGRSSAELLTRLREQVSTRSQLLASYDYRGVLKRGYALVWDAEGRRLVQRGLTLEPESAIRIQFQDAQADARVTRVRPPAPEEAT
jgi:exodeoxyribonuclease VII large subunit